VPGLDKALPAPEPYPEFKYTKLPRKPDWFKNQTAYEKTNVWRLVNMKLEEKIEEKEKKDATEKLKKDNPPPKPEPTPYEVKMATDELINEDKEETKKAREAAVAENANVDTSTIQVPFQPMSEATAIPGGAEDVEKKEKLSKPWSPMADPAAPISAREETYSAIEDKYLPFDTVDWEWLEKIPTKFNFYRAAYGGHVEDVHRPWGYLREFWDYRTHRAILPSDFQEQAAKVCTKLVVALF